MGKSRHQSGDDSDYDDRKARKKKKRRARSRSRSSGCSESSRYSSSRVKKSKKRSRKPSRSRSHSSERNRAGRSRKSRSASRDRDRYVSRRSYSRSPVYRSRRRSRSRSRSYDRRLSPSYSRSHRSRSRGRRSRSRSRDRRSRSRDRRSRSHSGSKTSSRRLSPEPATHKLKSEDVEERLRLALKAAALADEQLRNADQEKKPSLGVLDRKDFADSIAEIESDSFVTSTFSSSRSNKVKDEPDLRASHDDAIFGSLSVTGFQLKPDPDMRPVKMDADSIIHPSLFCDTDDKMDRWIQRLTQLRRKKLEGDALQT